MAEIAGCPGRARALGVQNTVQNITAATPSAAAQVIDGLGYLWRPLFEQSARAALIDLHSSSNEPIFELRDWGGTGSDHE